MQPTCFQKALIEALPADLPKARLAAAVGVSKKVIFDYFAGRAMPTPEKFEKLISVLGNRDSLLGALIATKRAALEQELKRYEGKVTD